MATDKPLISPKTRIGELLDAWPHLEDVLISMSPVFAKLRNPILRKTVAKVATIQQISVVGSIPVEQIINRLRKETGQDELQPGAEDTGHSEADQPGWFSETKISARFDATPVINSGGSPMAEVLRLANSLGKDEILELKTPFVPAPILDMLGEKKFKFWSVRKSGEVFSYISPA
jgi:hypothetical protein